MENFFGYFQLLVMICFLLFVIGNVLYFRFKKKINVIALGSSKKVAPCLLELFLYGGAVIWSFEVFFSAIQSKFHIFPSPFDIKLIDILFLKLIGVFIIVIGFFIFVRAVVSLGDSWRIGSEQTKKSKLVTTGMYALSRNPIYLFFDLYFIGTFLINGTLIFLLFMLTMILVFHYQSIQEEKILRTLYGKEYEEYWNKTPRYFSISLYCYELYKKLCNARIKF